MHSDVDVSVLDERERRRLTRAAQDKPGTSLTAEPVNGDEEELEEESTREGRVREKGVAS